MINESDITHTIINKYLFYIPNLKRNISMYNLIFMNMHFNHGILCFNKFYNTVLISDGSLIIKSGFE